MVRKAETKGALVKIAEVSKLCGVSADTLRYYERAGLLRHIPRNASGIRDYNEANIATVRFVKCMRSAGVSIEALIEYMNLFDQGDATLSSRKALLEEQRDLIAVRVADMQAGLDRLDFKIANYETLIVAAEEKMRSGEAPCSQPEKCA